jgi:ATP phosphoribosyltransferase regulatory subunit HisZ
MKGSAERVAKKISEVGPEVVESMQKFCHSMEIPAEKLDAYLHSITSGGIEKTLRRIAIQFLPKKDQVQQQVLDLAKTHPLSFLFTKTLQDHKGRPVATIGSIEDDLDGNIIN